MIQFGHKEFFWAFILLLVFVLLYGLYRSWKKRAVKSLGDPALVDKMMLHRSGFKTGYRFILLLLALFFLVLGIIDPEVGSRLETVKRKGIDMVVALDVSNSMLAEDIRPNRLDRAKMAVSNLIDKLDGDRVGLIVFAGKAYKQLPLTTDYGAAKLFLSAVDTKIVPSQGTAIGAAIQMATASFDDPKHNRAIVIITDGENHQDDAVSAAKAAAAKGVKVFTIGMGLPDGAPIPIYDASGNKSFLKDRSGKVVITKLNEAMLQEIAVAGNGAYARANNANVGLENILNRINKIQKKELETKQFTDYEHRFQFFLAWAILFLILEVITKERKSEWTDKLDFFGK
jgi:Ca-activated chloride channel family protein